MRKEKLLESKQQAEEAIDLERKNRILVTRMFKIFQELYREMGIEPPGGPAWAKLNGHVEEFTEICSFYVETMKSSIGEFQMFPRVSTAIQGHIDTIEEIYRQTMGIWLDMKRSLPSK